MALPFHLPALSRGFAALTPAVRRRGVDAAAGAAEALRKVLDAPVALVGRTSPGVIQARTPVVRLAVDLAAVPALAVLEVEPALVAGLVDRLAGGDGQVACASSLTSLEQSAFELLALMALDGACTVPGIEETLRPRLARASTYDPEGALGIEVDLASGAVRGRARLLLPVAAVRALDRLEPEAELPDGPLRLPVSVRRGTASLLPEELEALEPGDVVLVKDPAGEAASLVLPGGLRARGTLAEEGFRVEETSMPTHTPQLPVTLEVELCRVELSLAELARLVPGMVLPLAVDRQGQVTLRSGERTVARGELVDVEGSIGVRIASLEAEP